MIKKMQPANTPGIKKLSQQVITGVFSAKKPKKKSQKITMHQDQSQ